MVFLSLFSVFAERVSESVSNATVSNSRESKQFRFMNYDNARQQSPQFIQQQQPPLSSLSPQQQSRIMSRISNMNGGGQKFNNHPPGLPPNMVIRRRVQSLPTSMIMKAKSPPRITMTMKPYNLNNQQQQMMVNSRPQVLKSYPRGPPAKQFYSVKVPAFSKAQITAAENKFKASAPFNGNVIVKAAPSSLDYKYETPVANSIRPNLYQREKGYSVYEVTDDLAQQKPVFNFPKQQLQQSQYQFYQAKPQPQQQQPQHPQHHHHLQTQYQQVKKPVSNDEAKRYMSFMGSNQYFLPKSEPDYKKIVPTPSAAEIRKQQIKSLKPVIPTTTVLTYFNQHTEPPPNTKFNYPVSYYSDDRMSGEGVSVKRGSKNPPPERFEFTENDAIHGAYTSSPILKVYDVKKKQVFSNVNRRHSQSEEQEKEETADDDEVMIATANVGSLIVAVTLLIIVLFQESDPSYSRVKIDNKKTDETNTVKPDPKAEDAEEYCERICSNVHDDDEQVICGSDGYMYTSEAQLECYSSCLHIGKVFFLFKIFLCLF